MIVLDDTVIFDRVDWYADNAELLSQAKERMGVLVKWLARHDMLNACGLEEAKRPIPDDFSLCNSVLNDRGVEFLKRYYEKWLFSEGTSDPVTTKLLDKGLKS